MIKKTITYEDYNGDEVTEDFYFNMTKLELAQADIEAGGLQDALEKINATEDAKTAFELFQKIVLMTYGVKSEDGRRFIKTPELTQAFQESPAMSELIFGFLLDPEDAAAFIEGTLPAKMVAEAKAQAGQQNAAPTETVELPTAPAQLEPAAEKKFEDYSRDELLAMSNEEFATLVPDKALDMTQDQLVIAMQRKNQVPTGA